MEPCTVLLLPSEDLGWGTLRHALGSMPEARVVGEATTVVSAATAIPRLRPDLILAAPALGGACVGALRNTLRGQGAFTGRVAFFADWFDPATLADFSSGDLAGLFVWSDLTLTTLVPCLLLLLAGGLLMRSPRLAGIPLPVAGGVPAAFMVPKGLTERERTVLDGMALGLRQEEIGVRACVSDRSVKRILRSLQDRFAAPSHYALGVQLAMLDLVGVPNEAQR